MCHHCQSGKSHFSDLLFAQTPLPMWDPQSLSAVLLDFPVTEADLGLPEITFFGLFSYCTL